MAKELISAIIASTPSPVQQLDSQRTDILYTQEAVTMVNTQVNASRDEGKPIPVYERAPKGRGDQPPIIGELVSCQIRYDSEQQSHQAVAEVFIYEESMRKALIARKKEYCFFPLVGYNNQVSLKKVYEHEGNEISYLQPPIKIMACHMGIKRSSSNPHLIIL